MLTALGTLARPFRAVANNGRIPRASLRFAQGWYGIAPFGADGRDFHNPG